MEKPKYIYFRESWFQSVVADCFMFATLCGAMAMNYFYFGNSWLWGLILFCIILLVASSRARHRVIMFYSVEELKKHVEAM